jgi:hypothetical protein
MTARQRVERARRKRAERGAAVFVVLLVVGLLTALGLFAVRSATLATLSGGYNRQLTQTHYVAEYGVLVATGDLWMRGDGHSYLMKSGQQQTCQGYAEQVADSGHPTCAEYSYDYYEQQVVQQFESTNNLIDPPSGTFPSVTPGSLGYRPIEGDMNVELTDWHPAWPPPAGNDATGGLPVGYAMVTVSVTGLVRPAQEEANEWDTASATAAGVETQRAHVLIGPVQLN